MLTLPLSLSMHPCLQAFTERHQPYNPNLYGRLPASKFDTRKSFQGSHLNRRCPAVQWINSRRVKNCMLCVICISRGGSASVSFSEVEERAVDLRNVSTVPSQSEPTRYVRTEHHWYRSERDVQKRHCAFGLLHQRDRLATAFRRRQFRRPSTGYGCVFGELHLW